ncbi:MULTISPECIES: CDP-glycerol glycerophosphotransferase family protein [Providencia]|uniref:CDP-glycerol glycerophosphotransferase family protein n=2 Tax=Providencia rettgeri TaxID=587 RepID=UPI001C22489B|nr:CDP-glycerol glycerophosphotransferase family protein [Providencia rettgeri]QXA57963.1 CDP-glycerol glycerophosphotransferase family protein [Providencia rettgeri]
MKKILKKFLPRTIISLLLKLNYIFFEKKKLRYFIKQANKSHVELTKKIQEKEKIKVLFLVIHDSVWKVDPIFQKMLQDSYFQPEILICPYTIYSDDKMCEDMNNAYTYFKEKGYPVIKSLKKDNSWITLSELSPDLVFFTNPHNLTRKEYYQDVFLNYLTCYIPYYFMATNHAGDNKILLNTSFLNCIWKIYWPHEFIYQEFKKHSIIKGKNSLVSGYPASECFVNKDLQCSLSVWKNHERKKIIYAPHHSIDSDSIATFLHFGLLIQKIAQNYQNDVCWSFKPHPLLREKLYLHRDWGKEKTDEYYSFWENEPYTQFDNGEYERLFQQSDAIIHDSSSFIVEYTFTDKPGLYLLNNKNNFYFLNSFGKKIINCYNLASNQEEIIIFIENIISNKKTKRNNSDFFNEYLENYYINSSPSEIILSNIKLLLTNKMN